MPLPRIIVDNKIDAAIANIEELDLDISFDEFSQKAEFAEDFQPEFVCSNPKNDAINLIDNWVNDGYFLQKIPCRYDFGIFNVQGFLDLGNVDSVYSTNPKIYKVKWENSQTSFFKQAKGLPITKLFDQNYNIINLSGEEGSQVFSRYVRKGVPDYLESILISITIFIMAKELIESIQRTIQTVKESIPTFVGTGADIGPIIRAIFNILMEALYQIAIILALNALLKDLSENIFAKPRKFRVLDVYNVIKAGCKYLGYDFESQALKNNFSKLTYAKGFSLGTDDKGESYPLGEVFKTPHNNPVPDVSLLEFIEKFTPLFNGKIRVTTDSKVTIETRLFYESTPINVRLSDLYNTGERRYKYQDVPQFITYEYQTDGSDQHVKQNKAVLEYSVDYTEKDLTQNNSLRVNLQYGVAERKQGQDSLERFFNGVFDLFAGLNKSYKVKGGDRIGFMYFNSDVLPLDLIYLRDGEKVSKLTDQKLNADRRIEESYLLEGIDQNQYVEITSRDKDPLCDQQTITQLINNNVCYDSSGNKIIVQKNIYDPKSHLFDTSYLRRVKPNEFGYVDPKRVNIKLISDIKGSHRETVIPT